jgi:hypothetical protein
MSISSLSISLAMKKIAAITCGTRPDAIQTKVIDPWNHVFTVSLPSEYHAPIYSYLARHIALQQPKTGQPLLLTGQEAAAILELALKGTPPLKAA